ncbi:hypothetical protein PNA2_1865 [Pyrococcus sp. NA2]|uniref:polysaccharide deacetylase family protein n=1 Tax=Pyrococcus sp. (strain NA2) TaxID=342949 RepID=UPI000209ACDE|nr:polysaccharide deacetylase family protein [Pyrococcus sp. NA2]AEC52780.1 hypothetical protein PNA2_1865 [Pyrococcus sp. NA2]
MIIILTFDVEPDCPPFINTERGLEEGLIKVLDVLDRYEVPGTFFFTAKWAPKYEEIVEIIKKNHELGCHGFAHERFDKLSKEEARDVLRKSKRILGDVKSFRAPNLRLPLTHYEVLSELGFLIDSSQAMHKGWRGIKMINGVLEVPVFTTSLVTRLPWKLQIMWHNKEENVKVFMFHPWEFVKMPKVLRIDCWFGTGERALRLLEKIIEFYKNKGAEFLTLYEFYWIYMERSSK